MKTITTLTSFIFIVNFSVAQPGTLDSSFGVNGKVVNENFAKIIWCTALQNDGKIIVGGQSLSQTVKLARYKTDGSFDSTFGENGIVTTDLVPGYQLYYSTAKDMLVQPDGKIVITGKGHKKDGIYGNDNIILIRYNSDGSLDESFGDNGVVVNDFGSDNEDPECIFQQPDGKIVIGGQSTNAFIARYNTDGSLDNTFNGIGWARYNSGFINSIIMQADQQLIFGGRNTGSFPNKFMVIRVKPDGKKDSSFGTNGVVTTDFAAGGGDESIYSMVLQPDEKIVVAGGTGDEDGDIALARYETNGTLDTSFGDEGKVRTKVGVYHSYAKKVLLQDGKIIVGGWSKDFMIAGYNEDGSLNDNFGDSGITVTDFGLSTGIVDAAIQQDGKVIGVGYRSYSALLARYNNEEPVTISFKKNERVSEGNMGITKASFKIILSQPSSKDISVNIATKDGTAIAGSDYKVKSGTVAIKAGRTSKNIEVNIIGDSIQENNEKFSLVLSNPVNAILGEHVSAECTIKNDDVLFALNNSSKENIESQNSASVKIFPNPVKDNLQLSSLSSTAKTTLVITDVSGKRKLTAEFTGSNYNLNISELKPGNYFLKIANGNNIVTRIFVKQ